MQTNFRYLNGDDCTSWLKELLNLIGIRMINRGFFKNFNVTLPKIYGVFMRIATI